MEHLHGWIFIYNTYTEKWEAARREHYFELFSGDKGNVLRSSTIDSLISILHKSEGDQYEALKLIK